MTRTAGALSPSIQSQVEAALAADPEIQAARQGARVGPTGIVNVSEETDDRPENPPAKKAKGGAKAAPEVKKSRKPGKGDYSPHHTAKPPTSKRPQTIEQHVRRQNQHDAAQAKFQEEKGDEFMRNLESVEGRPASEEEELEGERDLEAEYNGRQREADDEDDQDGEDETERAEIDEDEDAEPADDEQPEEDEDQDERPKRPSLKKALEILRLEGMKTSMLEKLSDEEKIALAITRRDARSKTEEMQRELAEYRKQKTAVDAESKTQDGAPAQPATDATPASTFDWKAATTRFAETYGPEQAELLEQPLTAMSSHFEQRLAFEKKALAPLFRVVANMQTQLARYQLADRIPELKDERYFAKVLDAARKLNYAAYQGDVNAMIIDSHSMLSANRPKQRDATPKAREARGAAQPTPSVRRSLNGNRPKTRHDAFGDMAVAFERGDRQTAMELFSQTS